MAQYLDLVGLPYRVGACGPDAYDCAGVCAEYLRRRGIELPDDAFCSPVQEYWGLRGSLADVKPQPDDVVLSLTEDGQLHVDVVLDTTTPMVLTSTRTRGVMVRRLFAIRNPIGVYTLDR